MLRPSFLFCYLAAAICFGSTMAGCSRSQSQVWDDTKSCSRHIGRGFSSLGGKQHASRQVLSKEQFFPSEQPFSSRGGGDSGMWLPPPSAGVQLPLSEEGEVRHPLSMSPFYGEEEGARGHRAMQSATPPSIEAFLAPEASAEWSQVFSPLHFPYDSDLIKGEENSKKIQEIAYYLKRHPALLVFIEGHCDQRGAEAYNLALGSRRANAVRQALMREKVDGDRLFTVSYGKERLLNRASSEEAYAQNRRAAFKVYER